jgi:nucleotide-binding universal stress UspA family protein
MKEVLVPIDFSEESLIALEHGIDIANHLQANVRVIHVKTDSVIVPFFTNNEADDRMSQDVEKWAEHLHNKFKVKYNVECGLFDYKIREGNIVKEICNQAKYGDSTLIVMGSHNRESATYKWVGSPAYRLVAHSPCPVLVVNKRMNLKRDIDSICLPVDYSIASRKKVPAIAGVARLFDAKVYVTGLKSSDIQWMNQQMNSFVSMVEKFVSSRAKVEVIHNQLTGKDHAKNIMNYAQ